ncbi:MAG TPA: RHS repeat-associated core domain-containing protein, partial [Tahibacter sp.]|nr:RHS repeat-associated core domain-containing protein [Tahibacter sp.]
GNKRYIYLGRHLIAEDGTAGRHYIHTDALGSPVRKTTSAGAASATAREDYQPYGWGPAATSTPGFTGHVADAETGLIYMQARYYDPYGARFLAVDPVAANEASFNRYWYANDNPYKNVDPDGRIPVLFLIVPAISLLSLSDYAQAPNIGEAPTVMTNGERFAAVADALTSGPRSLADMGARGAREVGNAAAQRAATKDSVGGPAITSRAARREAMRDAGIPTSQQPASQSRNQSGHEYSYDVPAGGGGTQRMSVQQQTMDRSHPGESHWEAGLVKTDADTGEVRMNRHGRPALRNGKSKVDY